MAPGERSRGDQRDHVGAEPPARLGRDVGAGGPGVGLVGARRSRLAAARLVQRQIDRARPRQIAERERDVGLADAAVLEVAVIGVPDEKWGERPIALVVLKPECVGQVSEHEIRNFAAHLVDSTGISRHGVLLQVRFVEALAKTSVGKINKREMRVTLQGSPSLA